MAYLTLKDINKIYPNGYHAVHNFNLEIDKGEFIVFVGPSGCGKSTTLRMIAGLEDISNGEFLINGKRANEMGPREREVAMVFQSYALLAPTRWTWRRSWGTGRSSTRAGRSSLGSGPRPSSWARRTAPAMCRPRWS